MTHFCLNAWNTLILKRLWLSHGPFYVILKMAMAVTLCLALDNYVTYNPDSITTTFVSITCLSSIVRRGWETGFMTFVAAMVGALTGTVCTIIFGLYGTLLLRIPIAVAFTRYIMYLAYRENDGIAMTTGAFSALFVQIAYFPYKYLPQETPLWLSTLVVRSIAVATAVVSATIVNAIVSGFFYERIYLDRVQYIQTVVTSMDQIAADPTGMLKHESVFALLNTLMNEIITAKTEVKFFTGRSSKLYRRLLGLEYVLKIYIKLLSTFAFIGYQYHLQSPENIELLTFAMKVVADKIKANTLPVYSEQEMALSQEDDKQDLLYAEMNLQRESVPSHLTWILDSLSVDLAKVNKTE